MNGTGEEEIIQEKKGSLAQMLFLIKIVDGISVSQSEFLEQLPGIIKKFSLRKKNRTELSSQCFLTVIKTRSINWRGDDMLNF